MAGSASALAGRRPRTADPLRTASFFEGARDVAAASGQQVVESILVGVGGAHHLEDVLGHLVRGGMATETPSPS